MPKLKPNQSWQPLYVGQPKWRQLFLLPGSALKLWLAHYAHENKDGESWPSIQTLMEETGLSEDTIFTQRRWLLDNHWLVLTGYVAAQHGQFGVPKFSVRRGTIPEKIRDGRENNRPGKVPTRTHPKTSDTDAPEIFQAEPVKRKENQRQEEPETSNQPINPSIKEPSAPENLPTDFETPSELESEPNQTPSSDLDLYFPRCPVTEENTRMFSELQAALMDEHIPLDSLLCWNWQHHAGKLRLRSLAQTHKAICHGSPENGVVIQFKTHTDEDCPQCRKRAKEQAAALKSDPMLRKIPLGFDNEFREEIMRKPRTKAERKLLLSWRGMKHKVWNKIAPWLSQDNCPQCHGDKRACPCIVMEDIL